MDSHYGSLQPIYGEVIQKPDKMLGWEFDYVMESKYWAFVSDYARLDVVYEYGGIYLDTDVEVLRNLDDLLYQEAYLGFESNLYIATGLGFVARKNHPIIKRMRDDYDARIFKKQDGAFNLVACPAYQTNYLKGYGLITNGQHQYIGDITI